MPSQIHPHTVNLILQYISPPSQLDHPLPPHLLSRPLLQRHLFLDIPPSDSTSYLCWNSILRDRAAALLESLQKPLDDHTSTRYPVQYSADEENTYAHVHVTPTDFPGLRLVFEWDGVDSWKFHDANLMPFPTGYAEDESPQGPKTPSEGDDDDYWNSYGGPDEDADALVGRQPFNAAKDDVDTSEDAYWAQYAAVQGTADSTIPSPKYPRRPVPPPEYPHHIHIDEPLPIPPATIRSRQGDPPCPDVLSQRLTAISPRNTRPPSTPASLPDPVFTAMMAADPDDYFSDPEVDGLGLDDDSDQTPSPPQDVGALEDFEGGLGQIASPRPQKANAVSFLSGERDDGNDGGSVDDGIDDGVKEAIRGVYRLWKATRGPGITETRADFLLVVRDAVEGL
ncbi:hypothetical protein OF83DRAFT_1080114 [Amylostereum chailletii]|nr:hypothetical protein OF83DRAFT_1080114 [Amylostereum chailletii]